MTSLMRVRAVGQGWTGGPGLMTFFFSGSASPTNAEAVEAAARVRAVLASAVGEIPTGVTWQVQGQVDVIEDSTGVLVGGQTVTAPAVVTGSGAGGLAPIASAALTRFATNSVVNGRRLQGRTFLSPLRAGAVSAQGTLLTASKTTLTTAYGLLVVQITTPITHRVWHRPGPLGVGSSAASVQNFVQDKLAVLRSRRD